ncbi:MAG: Phosphoglycolate phosphatase [Candidatus Anoxychlamydiales bacterium]|nr:Phosphoglycolate phosphatase [Candidatus Anoxychlamydiales bacterium]
MLIIFDLDDTLIDTSGSITPVFLKKTIQTLIKNGLKIDENSAFEKIIKIDKTSSSSKESVKNFLLNVNANKFFYDIAYRTMTDTSLSDIKILTLKNANQTLKYLSNFHKLAIVTIGDEKFQFYKIKKAGIDTSIFSKIVVAKSNDKEPYYKKIIEELKTDVKKSFVCGDKVKIDLLSAKKIGCRTIHMNWGRGKKIFNKKEDSKLVDYTINSFEEIKTILEN